MTGYGSGTVSKDGRQLALEFKAVNHRYLDLNFRIGKNMAYLEEVIRKAVQETLSRGHVDVYMNYNNEREDARTIRIDYPLLNAYIVAYREAESTGLKNDLTLTSAMRINDVVRVEEAEEDAGVMAELAQEAARQALLALDAMRRAEGERLKQDMLERLGAMRQYTVEIAELAPAVVVHYREKLNKRIEDLLAAVEVDQGRLSLEIALFADKCSIDEELVRLRSHFEQFEEISRQEGPVGRKLDFLVQEMNREINTIGSKASDISITNHVLSLKNELEKIREQVQNIE
ncbi:MAG: YicC/YloC family endoribonuclease [Christensenellales bacterium]